MCAHPYDRYLFLAFCSDQIIDKERPLFPLGEYHPWKNIYEPWIMDAVIADGGSLVNILVADAQSCRFDLQAWQRFVAGTRRTGIAKLYHALANGSYEAINVEYPASLSSDQLFTANLFVGTRVSCRYYDRKSLLITSVLSYKIIEGMIIRCPIPLMLRSRASSTADDRLHLRLSIPLPIQKSSSSHRTSRRLASTNLRQGYNTTSSSSSMTALRLEGRDHVLSPMFGVCPQPSSNSKAQSASTADNQTSNSLRGSSGGVELRQLVPAFAPHYYRYNISICASTVSRSKIRLVEWIEYHRILGVEHFFVYDRYIRSLRSDSASIAPSSSQSADAMLNEKDDEADDDDDEIYDLSRYNDSSLVSSSMRAKDSLFEILRDYIDYGIVTVVPWPYKDCVDHMACDRSLRISSANEQENLFFEPPPKLQKAIALQSCYLRFQSSSRYMALLDDKDFLVFPDNDQLSPAAAAAAVPIPRLASLLIKLEASHHNLAAVEFLSTAAISCPSNESSPSGEVEHWEEQADEEGASQPSRYGIWQHLVDLPISMKKILVKTAIVSSISQSHALVVELPTDSSAEDPHLLASASSASGDSSSSMNSADPNYVPRLARRVGRRGSASSKDKEEYSIAQTELSDARILEYRNIDDRASNLCERALFDYRARDEVCASAKMLKELIDPALLEQLTLRYTHGMAGDILDQPSSITSTSF
jgi:hypothetical protein